MTQGGPGEGKAAVDGGTREAAVDGGTLQGQMAALKSALKTAVMQKSGGAEDPDLSMAALSARAASIEERMAQMASSQDFVDADGSPIVHVAPVCVKYHSLKECTPGQETGFVSHRCNDCKRAGIKAPDKIWRCEICNYDQCTPCSMGTARSVKGGDDAAVGQASAAPAWEVAELQAARQALWAAEEKLGLVQKEAAQTEVGLQEEIKALQEELALQRIQRTREAAAQAEQRRSEEQQGDLQAERQRQAEEIQRLQSEIQRLQDQLRQQQAEIQQQQADLLEALQIQEQGSSDFVATIASLQGKVSAMEASAEDARQAEREHLARIEGLSQDLVAAQQSSSEVAANSGADRQDFEAVVAQWQRREQELQEQLAEVTNSSVNSQALAREMEGLAKDAVGEKDLAIEEKNMYAQQAGHWEQQAQAFEQRNREIEEHLKGMQLAEQDHGQHLQDVQKLQSTIAQMEGHMGEQKRREESYQNQAVEYLRRCSELEAQMERMQQQEIQEQRHKEELQANLGSEAGRIAELENVVRTMQEREERLLRLEQEFSSQLQSQQFPEGQLAQENAQLQRHVEQLNEQLRRSEDSILHYQNELLQQQEEAAQAAAVLRAASASGGSPASPGFSRKSIGGGSQGNSLSVPPGRVEGPAVQGKPRSPASPIISPVSLERREVQPSWSIKLDASGRVINPSGGSNHGSGHSLPVGSGGGEIICSCGSVMPADLAFCRTCGQQRPGMEHMHGLASPKASSRANGAYVVPSTATALASARRGPPQATQVTQSGFIPQAGRTTSPINSHRFGSVSMPASVPNLPSAVGQVYAAPTQVIPQARIASMTAPVQPLSSRYVASRPSY